MLVNVIISPWFLIAAIPTCVAYLMLQRFYRRSARELQRLDGSTRGPAAAHFSETLAGLTTLRAWKQQDRFMEDMLEHLDSNTNAFLVLNTSSRWLGIALVRIHRQTRDKRHFFDEIKIAGLPRRGYSRSVNFRCHNIRPTLPGQSYTGAGWSRGQLHATGTDILELGRQICFGNRDVHGKCRQVECLQEIIEGGLSR